MRRGTSKTSPSMPLPAVKALQRGLVVLRFFDAQHPEWSLSELARASGLPKATLARILATLESEGFVTFEQSTGKYYLGPSVFQFAYTWFAQVSLARLAQPHLERLTEATGETANLMVWDGQGALCIAQSPTPSFFQPRLRVGHTMMDIANADAKVLLAFGPDERIREVLSQPIKRLTPFTITDTDRYRAELQRVREEGVAFDVQEQRLGVCAIAAPVRDFTGEVRASISIVMPESRFNAANVKAFTEALHRIASTLSYDLGYRFQEEGGAS